MSPEQARAVRAHFNLTLQDVERGTGISGNSISRFENELGTLQAKKEPILKKYYEDMGIEFTDFDGIRRKPFGSFQELSGFDGFQVFINDVYATINSGGNKEIMVSNVDERQFNKWFGTNKNEYINRMVELNKHIHFKFKIIIKQNDDYFLAADYAEYRWLEDKYCGNSPFYVYGDKTAIIIFKEDNVNIYIIDNYDVTDSFRKHFFGLWKISCIPN